MSLALYVLCAIVRERSVAVEAGGKYFLAGSLASGLFLMGIALLYGATGKLDVPSAAAADRDERRSRPPGSCSCSRGSRSSSRSSLPPVGGRTSTTARRRPSPGFMSTAVKIAGVHGVVPVRDRGQDRMRSRAGALAWLAIATMVVGNVGALAQTSVKRMMAYSSIGHAGFLLLGPVAWSAGSHAGARGDALLSRGVHDHEPRRVRRARVRRDPRGRGPRVLRPRRPPLAEPDDGDRALRRDAVARRHSADRGVHREVPALRRRGASAARSSAAASRSRSSSSAILSSLVSLGYYLRVIVVMYMSRAQRPAAIIPRFSAAFRPCSSR